MNDVGLLLLLTLPLILLILIVYFGVKYALKILRRGKRRTMKKKSNVLPKGTDMTLIRFCENCGEAVRKSVKYCPNCGKPG